MKILIHFLYLQMETVTDFIIMVSKNHCRLAAAMKLKDACSLEKTL